MVANNLELDNLTILYDNHKSQLRSMQIPNPTERLKAFGCEVFEVNGHDVEAIEAAFEHRVDGVKAIVANTVKGYGCKTLVENMFEWHRKAPTPQQLEMLIEELNAPAV